MPAAIHRIKVPAAPPAPRPLPLGGVSPQGRNIQVNARYLTLDGQPWLPVMGEFHFSRYPRERWEAELQKMKAGGITIASTYLFWIHVEEIEGRFDWSGNNDIRHFIELCARVGLYAYPRIGPWAHGECRNGGFPDWLLQKCGQAVRKDALPYLTYVRRFYQAIYQQLQGLLWKDGGPIVGIQIENELLNNAGHIHTLLAMAREIGFDVPLYSMTGWGPADVPPGREIIPVFGGYPDAFWERQVQTWARDSRKHYFFSSLRDDNAIGADLNQREGVSDLSYLEDYPFGTCELGGGMQVAYHRRPLIETDDIAALAQVKIGNDSNLQGYYMYHGGANPPGQNSTLQESQATGYWNDLPVINYDFQAPIGQYGQVRASYHALRPLHLFLQAFGASLATMPMHLPEDMPKGLDDAATLRWSVRSDGRSGFVFINNYQRVEHLPDQPPGQFQICLPGEEILFPAHPVAIRGGSYAIWPFNLDLNGALLKYATAQPVCQLAVDGVPTWVFFAQDGIPPVLAFDAGSVAAIQAAARQTQTRNVLCIEDLKPGADCRIQLETRRGQSLAILILTQAQARQLWKVTLSGQARLLLCPDGLYVDNDRIYVQAPWPGRLDLAAFPRLPGLATSSGQPLAAQPDGVFTRYTLDLPVSPLPAGHAARARLLQPAGPARVTPVGPLGVAQAPEDRDFQSAGVWRIDLPETAWALCDDPCVQEVFLRIRYAGDVARLYTGDQLLDDQFYNGQPWEIGLSRFRQAARGQALTLRILPLRTDAPIYLPRSQWPDFDGRDSSAALQGIDLSVLGKVELIAR